MQLSKLRQRQRSVLQLWAVPGTCHLSDSFLPDSDHEIQQVGLIPPQ